MIGTTQVSSLPADGPTERVALFSAKFFTAVLFTCPGGDRGHRIRGRKSQPCETFILIAVIFVLLFAQVGIGGFPVGESPNRISPTTAAVLFCFTQGYLVYDFGVSVGYYTRVIDFSAFVGAAGMFGATALFASPKKSLAGVVFFSLWIYRMSDGVVGCPVLANDMLHL